MLTCLGKWDNTDEYIGQLFLWFNIIFCWLLWIHTCCQQKPAFYLILWCNGINSYNMYTVFMKDCWKQQHAHGWYLNWISPSKTITKKWHTICKCPNSHAVFNLRTEWMLCWEGTQQNPSLWYSTYKPTCQYNVSETPYVMIHWRGIQNMSKWWCTYIQTYLHV